MIIGYTSGVFDLFHIGHVRVLKNARAMCDRLIVGVSTDELVRATKNKSPVIPFNERLEVVSSIKYVDVATAQTTGEKLDAWQHYKFNYMFVGDDWHQSAKWEELEARFKELEVKIIYFPYTQTTSSTLINKTLADLRK
ncbi:glycerol-3-phosphate cytidylyltransferase [Halieaceae bacterium IMCC14734]|uniref:Glycerol-3-phosphate cytidylyltransferase n=1 Tax=Candidatus Litorirhabdus singularis TaxID=2518993 RepID=A0ABT3TBD4_9GAMM|nr:adenylyltransferase/cytidyltransferase family protein [Candidatus Litorirhabdus singularis]MCX2979602.1 glycerol-3-phosphate cytidylyltransferase [Candidatus Litorirhabdus singularis]